MKNVSYGIVTFCVGVTSGAVCWSIREPGLASLVVFLLSAFGGVLGSIACTEESAP